MKPGFHFSTLWTGLICLNGKWRWKSWCWFWHACWFCLVCFWHRNKPPIRTSLNWRPTLFRDTPTTWSPFPKEGRTLSTFSQEEPVPRSYRHPDRPNGEEAPMSSFLMEPWITATSNPRSSTVTDLRDSPKALKESNYYKDLLFKIEKVKEILKLQHAAW